MLVVAALGQLAGYGHRGVVLAALEIKVLIGYLQLNDKLAVHLVSAPHVNDAHFQLQRVWLVVGIGDNDRCDLLITF